MEVVETIFDMEIKVQIVKMDPTEREAEIRRFIDEIQHAATDSGITFFFCPKGRKSGPFVKFLGTPPKTVRFDDEDDADIQLEPLPKMGAYTSGWAATKKAAEYTNSNLPFSCKCSVDSDQFYAAVVLKLMNRDVELRAKRFNLKNDNVAAAAAIAPATASFDSTAVSLWFLKHHNVYVNFVTAKVNHENHTWKECFFGAEEVDGILCVCSDDDLIKVAQICKEVWPVKGRHREMASYPAYVKGSAFLFDGTGKIHRMYRERFSSNDDDGKRKEGHLLYKNMQAEYHHSRQAADDNGGRFTTKLIRNVDSLTTPITKVSGETTCLREFITNQVDAKSGKKIFPSLKPAPTKGNKNGVLTIFTTYRAGNLDTRRDIAKRAKEHLTGTVIKKIWDTFGADEARKVLSNNICQRLEMDQGVTLEDVLGNDEEFVGMEFLMDTEEDMANLDEMSVQSAWANSAVTTQSTRDRLIATQTELEELEAAMAEKDVEHQEQQQERQVHLEQIDTLEKQADVIRAEKDAEIADLMRRLEAATTGTHQGHPTQSNDPEHAIAKPVAPLISPPRSQTHKERQPAEPMSPRAPSVEMGAGPD